jgi:hypothetical protein
VHAVLTDVVRAVAARRHKLDQQALLRERVSLMQAMLRSCGRITIEVETADCTIAAMSPGAEFFFKDAPWGSTLGQSLRDFVQWEDLENFNTLMMNPAGLPIEDQACSIRLIHFAVSDFPPLPQHIATSPFDESALERGGVGGSSSSAAGKGGTMSSSSHSGGGHTDSADSRLSAAGVAHAAGLKHSAGSHAAEAGLGHERRAANVPWHVVPAHRRGRNLWGNSRQQQLLRALTHILTQCSIKIYPFPLSG